MRHYMKRLLQIAVMLFICLAASHSAFSQNAVSPEEVFKSAMEMFTMNQYSKAKDRFQMILTMENASAEQKSRANEAIKKCNQKLAVINEVAKKKLELTTYSISFDYTGGPSEIKVSANTEWDVYKRPEWCRIIEISQSTNTLKIFCEENPVTFAREADITIGVPGNKKTVHVYQAAGVSKLGAVVFRTSPQYAYIEIDSGKYFGKSGQAFDLPAGKHSVLITKEGYVSYENEFEVKAGTTKDSKVYDIKLAPKFGLFEPHITLEDNEEGIKPAMWIDDIPYNFQWGDYAAQKSFDTPEDIAYFYLYKGDRIPLLPKRYKIKLKADGYKDYVNYIDISPEDTLSLQINMELVTGCIHFENEENADSAQVYANGVFKGYVGNEIRLPVGKALIELKKPGYSYPEGIREMEITEDACIYDKIRMIKVVPCKVSTNVGGENVLLDGQEIPYQIGCHEFNILAGDHTIEIAKEGYWTYKDTFTVGEMDTLVSYENIALESVHPLTIQVDERGLQVKLTPNDGRPQIDYGVEPERTQIKKRAEKLVLNVPYGKYKIEIYRPTTIKRKHTAYKGSVEFKEEKDNRKYIVWPSTHALLFGCDYNLGYFVNSNSGVGLNRMYGSAYIGQIRIFNGFSSNIVKMAAFKNTDQTLYPEELDKSTISKNLFGISCIMLNGEFRVGGDIYNGIDASALVTYAWYPQLVSILPMSHMSGHDLFVGVELSSLLPVFNANVKIGWQGFFGNRNFFTPANKSGVASPENFCIQKYNSSAFVISVGFSLGSTYAKGKNILRVF